MLILPAPTTGTESQRTNNRLTKLRHAAVQLCLDLNADRIVQKPVPETCTRNMQGTEHHWDEQALSRGTAPRTEKTGHDPQAW